MTIDRQPFETCVHEALTHYADSARLQASPLLTELVPEDLPLDERLGRLRELLREAVQSLRPPETVPLSEPEWLPYRILWARYIQRQSRVRISQEMSLSRATYYRYQSQAICCAARALRSLADVGAASAGPALAEAQLILEASGGDRAVEEAERLARASRREAVPIGPLLAQVETIVSGLLSGSGIELTIELADGLPPALGDPSVLRQVFVNLLAGSARLISSVAEGDTGHKSLLLAGEHGDEELVFRLAGVALGDEPLGFRVGRQIVEAYGGAFAVERTPCTQTVRFALPVARPITILLVDDDEETLNLYRRYLSRAGYLLQAVHGGEMIWQALDDERPDLILLDVLMPRQDGWLVLQRLKTVPETADIPVVVASVLAQPELALALGAQGVISKPITESALLEAISSALADSADAP